MLVNSNQEVMRMSEHTKCELAKHKTPVDKVWISINKKVFDVTELCIIHPFQSNNVILRMVEKSQYQDDLLDMHPTNIRKKMQNFLIGKLICCSDKNCQECYAKK